MHRRGAPREQLRDLHRLRGFSVATQPLLQRIAHNLVARLSLETRKSAILRSGV